MKFNYLKKILGCFLCLFSAFSYAQTPDFLVGKLIDSQTNEPVVFATIRIKDNAKGVISNYDGGFIIPIRYKKIGDAVIISSMGYNKKEISLGDFTIGETKIIYISPSSLSLHEVVVTAKQKKELSARKIIKRAIHNIPNNYSTTPFSAIGYYRDYQIDKEEYINMNEGIFEVFDKGFSEYDHSLTKVKIYDYKKNKSFAKDKLASKKYDYKHWSKIIDKAFLEAYGGNEFTILRIHDAIRNYNVNSYSFVNKLESDFLKNHTFSKKGVTFFGDEEIYNINFSKIYPNYSAYGVIYIGKRDFAIHKMEYALYDKREKLPVGVVNKHGTKGKLIFEIITEYQKQFSKMYPNYISLNNSFTIVKPPRFTTKDISFNIRYKRFEVLYNNEPIYEEALNKKNYEISYLGEKMKIARILNPKKTLYYVFLKPFVNESVFLADMSKIRDKTGVATDRTLEIEIKKIKDIYGNLINESFSEDYNQYREFFVQEIKTNNSMPQDKDSLFMNMYEPIFGEQPIMAPDNFDEYWMNTPLKKKTN